MSNTINMITEGAKALGLDVTKPMAMTQRSQNIIRHYQMEVDRGHMTKGTALERCLGDLAGRNYKPDLEQRGEVRL